MWQRLMPIRTVEHAAWAAGIGGIGLVAGGLVSNWNDHFPYFLCTIAGTLPSFATNLPATLRIEWTLIGLNPMNAVEDSLYRVGWRKVENNMGQARYVQRGPSWLRWKTAVISIEEEKLYIVVRGPVSGLLQLRKDLLGSRNDA
jgi:hypothetical protein